MAAITGTQLQGGSSSGISLQGSGSTVQNTLPVQTAISGQVLQPTVNGGALNTGGYSTGGTAAPVAAPIIDPYAAWGGKAAYDKAVGDFNDAKGSAYDSINGAVDSAAGKYNSSILDFLTTYGQGQRSIDRAATQNELAKTEGRLGVTDMVGRGVASGGAILSNANASNSTAAEEIAKAYARYGQKELSKVGNQYELGNENIKGQQQDLNEGLSTFQRHMGESKTETVNSIVNDASTKLAQLNALAQNSSLSERISIEQEKARIRNDAMGKLTAFDSVLSNGVASNAPKSVDDNRAEAQRLLQAGVAPENSFNFSTAVPTQFQNTGPFASDLPIFTGAPKKPTDTLGV